jgi:hypothetical protein
MMVSPKNARQHRERNWVEYWDPDSTAYCDDMVDPTDFPVTSTDIPVYSPRLIEVVKRQDVDQLQLLPIRIRRGRVSAKSVGITSQTT